MVLMNNVVEALRDYYEECYEDLNYISFEGSRVIIIINNSEFKELLLSPERDRIIRLKGQFMYYEVDNINDILINLTSTTLKG